MTSIGPDLAKNISNTSNKHLTDYIGISVTESICLSQFLILNYRMLSLSRSGKKSFDNHCLNMWIAKNNNICIGTFHAYL